MNYEILSNKNILLVEDDSNISELIKLSFDNLQLNINMFLEPNGLRGLDFFINNQESIDLIITDLNMPYMNGIEMSMKIRQYSQDIPIIVLTAYQENDYFISLINNNISAYVLKPIDLNNLILAMTKAIEPKELKKLLIQENIKLLDEINKNKELHQIMIAQSRFASMGELINMIAHQWRQPLSSIGTAVFNLKLLFEKFKLINSFKKEDVEKLNDLITKKISSLEFYIHTLSSTIDDFRNFYTINKNKSKITLYTIFDSVYNIIGSSIEEHNIQIIKNINYDKEINVFSNELIHVIINILNNSRENFIEKSIDNKIIIFDAIEENNKVFITISDNGGGVPSELLNKIAEPYFSTKELSNGTGLGLYMSKIIIEKHHNGIFNISNTNIGLSIQIILDI